MVLTGKIVLDNNIKHIFSGDDINLTIEIESQEDIFIDEILLNFRGEINVKWEDLINKPKDGKIIYIMQQFQGQQICADKHITIKIFNILSRGKYRYNIMLSIPPQIPQSVERKYGCIKYYLELRVYHKLGMDFVYRMPLVIKQVLNICSKSEYKQPFRTVFQKSYCWGFCNSQPLQVILNLPTCSFVAGDSIKYFVSIQNCTKFMDLQRLSVILTQTQHYKALKPKERIKQVHTTLNLMMHHFNRQHHNRKFEGSLKLPHTLIPTSQES
ncbi:arrestin domain-containing protein 3-like [Lucilia sericata]|uniref:arrestin domain-containing protein 3-like n=1 Tax=Lucilia sericata TaxID=13632 RepID=UPI0018A84AEC|nr:arrestin domain-containing protein 3-like [Lucilia sericata]